MSAHQMHLLPWLETAVSNNVLSPAQAWALHDLALITEYGQMATAPPEWWPWMQRLHLFETEPQNKLPI